MQMLNTGRTAGRLAPRRVPAAAHCLAIRQACFLLPAGSADHSIKFWEWGVGVDEATGAKQLGINHTR